MQASPWFNPAQAVSVWIVQLSRCICMSWRKEGLTLTRDHILGLRHGRKKDDGCDTVKEIRELHVEVVDS